MPDSEDMATQGASQDVVEEREKQELDILQALQQKGPALPVEVAVRTFSLPEEIAAPLAKLEQEGEVARQKLHKGEMLVLTEKGLKRVEGT